MRHCFSTKIWLLPQTKANDVRLFTGTFYLFFDEHIMDVIQKKINTRIANTLSRLRAKPSFVESAKYTWVRETGRRGTGYIYFRGLLGFNLYMTDHLFADNEGYFVFGVIMSKTLLMFLLSHITFDDLTDQPKKLVHRSLCSNETSFRVI